MSSGDPFAHPAPRVFTVPAGAAFLDGVARTLIATLADPSDPFALADALILAPNNRSKQALAEAFRVACGGAAIIPRLLALGDLDEDGDILSDGGLALDAPPAIDQTRRCFELARLVMHRSRQEGDPLEFAAALASAEELARLLDQAAIADEVQWGKLETLVDEPGLAEHWRRSARFLSIVAEAWPKRLAEDGLLDPWARRTRLQAGLAQRWRSSPPRHPVAIVGSTGSIPATRALMDVVARLPRGCVVLPGLDLDLDEAAWLDLDEQHPQRAMRHVLQHIGLERAQVRVWPGAPLGGALAMRRRLINEALRPADKTSDWIARLDRLAAASGLSPAGFVGAGLEGLSLIEARTEDAEAMAIALVMREVLETPGRTAALVTPDSGLAMRVQTKLARWGVKADMSSGEPLEETPPGAFLRLLGELALDAADPARMAAVFKHPLCALGRSRQEIRRIGADFEIALLRGVRRAEDLTGYAGVVEPGSVEAKKLGQARASELGALLKAFQDAIRPAERALRAQSVSLDEVAAALARSAEAFARTDVQAGDQHMWAGPAGEAAGDFIRSLMSHGAAAPEIAPRDLPRVLGALMRGRVVRTPSQGHPRLRILGPLEARLQSADLMILGGLNEGAWPQPAPVDPFLSRAMRARLGLAPLEARIALSAHDFAALACEPQVVLTRAQRASGAPAVASRWVWRIKALVKGALGEAGAAHALAAPFAATDIADHLDEPASYASVPPPEPRPPAAARPRVLAVTDVDALIRDPYAIYARRVLQLRKLDDLAKPVGPAERGTAIHAALQEFARAVSDGAAPEAELACRHVAAQLRSAGFPPERLKAEVARLEGAARAFARWERTRRQQAACVAVEVTGDWSFDLPSALCAERVRLTGRADRIEWGPGGGALVDIKTGEVMTAEPGRKYSPQLPLEAAMLSAGAFEGLAAMKPRELLYWAFRRGDPGERPAFSKGDLETHVQAAVDGLARLWAHYLCERAAFLSKPHPQLERRVDDYDHLARRAEWANAEGEE
jgi:ATP-dependent helicase/nuclease subunit B